MLAGMAGKVLAALMSISLFVSSSYTGNDPVFKPLQVQLTRQYLHVTTQLEHAFDNDWQDVFKCGKPVHIWYDAEIRDGSKTVWSTKARHTVTYNPMQAVWQVYLSESKTTKQTQSYPELLHILSAAVFTCPYNKDWIAPEFRVNASLSQLELTQNNRKIDLMILWKYHKPSLKTGLSIPKPSGEK